MAVRSFRDFNPYLIGIASVLVIGAMVGAAFLVGVLHLLEDTYTVRAVFADAAGIRGGDDVKVAGVDAGRVTRIVADRTGGNVIVEMVVDRGVDLGRSTHAEIALETLLGTKYVRLSGPVARPYLADLDAAERVIPRERTATPFDVFELTTLGARRVQATDTDKLNRFITQLAEVTQGNAEDIRGLLAGVADVSAAVNARDVQLRELLDRFDRLTALLDDKDATLVALIDQSQAVLDLVSRRRGDIRRGIRGTDKLATELSHLVGSHRAQLDAILSTVHPALDIVAARAGDVDAALTWLGPGALGLARATVHGPWADIYVRAVGPDYLKVANDVLSGSGSGAGGGAGRAGAR